MIFPFKLSFSFVQKGDFPLPCLPTGGFFAVWGIQFLESELPATHRSFTDVELQWIGESYGNHQRLLEETETI